MAARKSALTVSEVKAIPFAKKERAALVKLIAEKEGITIRTAQRRITTAGQKRGQTKELSAATGNALRRFIRETPVMELVAHGRTKGEVRGNTLVQETFSNREDAINRARELQAYANKEKTYTPFSEKETDDEEEDYDEEEDEDGVNDPDLYPGSLFDNIHEIDVQYVPAGSRYVEGDVHHQQKLTAPKGGIWIVKASN